MTDPSLPTSEAAAPRRPFRVVILTCSDFGWETANVLVRVPEIELAAVVSSP